MRVWVFSKFVSVSTRYIGRWFVSIKVFAAYNPIILMQKNTAEKMFAPAISKKVFNEIFKMFVRCSPIEAIKVIALEITNSNAKKIIKNIGFIEKETIKFIAVVILWYVPCFVSPASLCCRTKGTPILDNPGQ